VLRVISYVAVREVCSVCGYASPCSGLVVIGLGLSELIGLEPSQPELVALWCLAGQQV